MLTMKLDHAGEYISPPRAGIWPCTQMPTPCFYARAFATVFRAALMARHGIFTDGDWARSSLEIMQSLEACSVQFNISGMRHITESEGSCVFIANHMSTLETFILPTLIVPYLPLTFVVKQSLIDYPLFKHIMRSRNPVVVQRTNAREDLQAVFKQGGERLAQGTSVVVFPQTTRTTTFVPEQFNSIGVKLAKRAGVPIIPIALKTDAWGNGKMLKDFGAVSPQKKVFIKFGQPLDSGEKTQNLQEEIVSFIQNNLSRWQSD